jgi:hypothetical protein
MAKGAKPDKQDQITRVFSKIAKNYDRQKKRAIVEAIRKGEFYYIDNPELLSIREQVKYFEAKKVNERGNGHYDISYDRDNINFPWPVLFAKRIEDK